MLRPQNWHLLPTIRRLVHMVVVAEICRTRDMVHQDMGMVDMAVVYLKEDVGIQGTKEVDIAKFVVCPRARAPSSMTMFYK